MKRGGFILVRLPDPREKRVFARLIRKELGIKAYAVQREGLDLTDVVIILPALRNRDRLLILAWLTFHGADRLTWKEVLPKKRKRRKS
jgi:hypothetical protein